MKSQLMVAGLALALATGTASAQVYSSAYTELDPGKCVETYSYEVGADYECVGWGGYPVLVALSDLRFSVSYGNDAANELAFGQGFGPFNSLGPRIEWLINDRGQAVGTILRWYIDRAEDDTDDQVLVVTKLGPGTTCHVAYIDARANSNANQLARSAAEMLLPDFRCGTDPIQTWGTWNLDNVSGNLPNG